MNAARLLKLAEHLETGKLGHKKFNFRHFSQGDRQEKRNMCGTSGCAIGECPVVWPTKWAYGPVRNSRHNYYPKLKAKRYKYDGVLECAEHFFDLNCSEATALFVSSNAIYVGGFYLEEALPTATRHEVAARIRKFVEWKTGSAA